MEHRRRGTGRWDSPVPHASVTWLIRISTAASVSAAFFLAVLIFASLREDASTPATPAVVLPPAVQDAVRADVGALAPDVESFVSELTADVAELQADPDLAEVEAQVLAARIESWTVGFEARVHEIATRAAEQSGAEATAVRAFVKDEILQLGQRIEIPTVQGGAGAAIPGAHPSPRVHLDSQDVEEALVAAIQKLLAILAQLPPNSNGANGVEKAIAAIRKAGANFDMTPPTVEILSPTQGAVLGAIPSTSFAVTDALSPVDLDAVVLLATNSGPIVIEIVDLTPFVEIQIYDPVANVASFSAPTVPDSTLNDGFIQLEGTGRDLAGNTGNDSVDVVLDRVAPSLTLIPQQGSTPFSAHAVAEVDAFDLVSGIQLETLEFIVDGQNALVAPTTVTSPEELPNRVVLTAGTSFLPGSHSVYALVSDKAGNTATELHLFQVLPNTPWEIETVLGDNQTGVAGMFAPEELIVRVKDSTTGEPVEGSWVTFQPEFPQQLVSPATMAGFQTDASGFAGARVRLPPEPGTYHVRAYVVADPGFSEHPVEVVAVLTLHAVAASLEVDILPHDHPGVDDLTSLVPTPTGERPGSAIPSVARVRVSAPGPNGIIPITGARIAPLVRGPAGVPFDLDESPFVFYPPVGTTDVSGYAYFGIEIRPQTAPGGYVAEFQAVDLGQEGNIPVSSQLPLSVLPHPVEPPIVFVESGQGQVLLPNGTTAHELRIRVENVPTGSSVTAVFRILSGEGTLLPTAGPGLFDPVVTVDGNVIRAHIAQGPVSGTVLASVFYTRGPAHSIPALVAASATVFSAIAQPVDPGSGGPGQETGGTILLGDVFVLPLPFVECRASTGALRRGLASAEAAINSADTDFLVVGHAPLAASGDFDLMLVAGDAEGGVLAAPLPGPLDATSLSLSPVSIDTTARSREIRSAIVVPTRARSGDGLNLPQSGIPFFLSPDTTITASIRRDGAIIGATRLSSLDVGAGTVIIRRGGGPMQVGLQAAVAGATGYRWTLSFEDIDGNALLDSTANPIQTTVDADPTTVAAAGSYWALWIELVDPTNQQLGITATRGFAATDPFRIALPRTDQFRRAVLRVSVQTYGVASAEAPATILATVDETALLGPPKPGAAAIGTTGAALRPEADLIYDHQAYSNVAFGDADARDDDLLARMLFGSQVTYANLTAAQRATTTAVAADLGAERLVYSPSGNTSASTLTLFDIDMNQVPPVFDQARQFGVAVNEASTLVMASNEPDLRSIVFHESRHVEISEGMEAGPQDIYRRIINHILSHHPGAPANLQDRVINASRQMVRTMSELDTQAREANYVRTQQPTSWLPLLPTLRVSDPTRTEYAKLVEVWHSGQMRIGQAPNQVVVQFAGPLRDDLRVFINERVELIVDAFPMTLQPGRITTAAALPSFEIGRYHLLGQ